MIFLGLFLSTYPFRMSYVQDNIVLRNEVEVVYFINELITYELLRSLSFFKIISNNKLNLAFNFKKDVKSH